MRRVTIGRLMTVVIWAALILSACRAVGLERGGMLGAWLIPGGVAWAVCRRWPDWSVVWTLFNGCILGTVAVAVGAGATTPGAGLVGMAALSLLPYPITLGSGLGRLSAARHAGRTAPGPRRSGRPGRASCCRPA